MRGGDLDHDTRLPGRHGATGVNDANRSAVVSFLQVMGDLLEHFLGHRAVYLVFQAFQRAVFGIMFAPCSPKEDALGATGIRPRERGDFHRSCEDGGFDLRTCRWPGVFVCAVSTHR